MRLPMVDCRSLIEFCKAFEQHKNMANSSNSNKSSQKPNPRASPKKQLNPFCEHSPFALLDILLLLVMLASLGFLAAPYLRFLSRHASEAIPPVLDLLSEAVREAPLAYSVGLVVTFAVVVGGIGVWEFLEMQSRKCGNGNCKGLRKAVEFDIQLESEECVRFLPQTMSKGGYGGGVRPLELGEDHKELEAELKRMAPVNGRTVLIFRAPCGCPAGRLEVWGAKKVRKIKK